MITASTAPVLSEVDGLTALERTKRNELILGLFLPIQNCGWTPSTAPRGTSWHFDYNARLAVRAEELGFDLCFGLALWTSKGGLGGKVKYWETTLDPLVTTAGLASVTNNIILVSTVHVLYGWHPLHLAKFGATLDHMSGGRWGLNVVTGYVPGEFQKFGRDQTGHDHRYEMASEFTDFMLRLWAEDENLSVEGSYWRMEKAFCTPKPVNGRPIMVNAGSSPAGMEFAAKYSDLLFITSPAGANIEDALEALPAHNANIKSLAAKHGREVRTIINPLIICRETEKEVKEICQQIIEGEDPGAVDGILKSQKGDQKSWRGHQRSQRIIGGNLQLFGTPEQIVDWCIKLKKAGCDGIHLTFFDFIPDLEFFGARVLPIMKQAGLRK